MSVDILLRLVRFSLFPFLVRWGLHWPALWAQRTAVRAALQNTTPNAPQLTRLLQLRQVGPVIATAILHVHRPARFVPLDRFTLDLIESEGVVPLVRPAKFYAANVAEYLTLCAAVRQHVRARGESIRSFVRRAR